MALVGSRGVGTAGGLVGFVSGIWKNDWFAKALTIFCIVSICFLSKETSVGILFI